MGVTGVVGGTHAKVPTPGARKSDQADPTPDSAYATLPAPLTAPLQGRGWSVRPPPEACISAGDPPEGTNRIAVLGEWRFR
jgi:hypothetical protein